MSTMEKRLNSLLPRIGNDNLELLLKQILQAMNDSPSVNDMKRKSLNLSFPNQQEFYDFGVKYNLIIISKKENDGNETQSIERVRLDVTIPHWSKIRDEALCALHDIFGNEFVREGNITKDSFDFCIRMKREKIPSGNIQEVATNISKIRVICLGSSFVKALSCLANGTVDSSFTHEIIVHNPRAGSCHCFCTTEKVTIIFEVTFRDEFERAIGRLFLQQYAIAQKKFPNSPHCDFYREPPLELSSKKLNTTKETVSGYLSFTFFETHVPNAAKIHRAAELIVNFFPFLDRHVKSAKANITIRMRQKRKELLKELVEVSPL